MLAILKPFTLYVALYLGVALTGGSVVHLPLDPARYLLIGAIGVLIFITASVADSRQREAGRAGQETGGLARYVGWSVVLSLGLGMLSGGIQHFLDSPQYVAVLLPLGLLLTLLAFVCRERMALKPATLIPLVAGSVVVAGALYLGLDHLAHGLDPHHSH